MTGDLPQSSANSRQYAAFISYNHRDRRWAEWLHRAIEAYRIPTGVTPARADATSAPRSLQPVFLDRAELPTSSDLAGTVRTALEHSSSLIVVCSRAAAQSRWVNEEVRVFKSLGREAQIFCLVVDGDPALGDCFPPAIRFKVIDGRVSDVAVGEPLAADLRPGQDDRRSAQLKIIAGLLGAPLDQLRQRDLARRQRRLAWIATASAIGCIAFATIALIAFRARVEADRQRDRAEQQALTARRTADFMKSLFAVSDPSESRGNSITAREVLDRGARQIDSQLKDAPIVRADLTTTLGEVYAGLGLHTESRRLLDSAASIPAKPPETTARLMTALGELQFQRGDYMAALRALDTATRELDRTSTPDRAVQIRTLSAYGDVYYKQDDVARARSYFEQTLRLASADANADQSVLARALEGVARADLRDGHFDLAVAGFQRAMRVQVAASGELHPRVSLILNQLGSLEYLRGRPAAAVPYFRRCLEIQRQVFGNRHPRTAPPLNNLARVLLEQREFREADRLLTESIEIRSSEVLETSDAMAFAFSNLALAKMGVGEVAEAEALFQKGLKAAIANQHRLHAPILVDLADAECRLGRFEPALQQLDAARPMMAKRYPDEPWRVAHADNVRAGCLTGLKRYADAASLVEASMPFLLAKWRTDSLYGHDALERAIRLYTRSGDRDNRIRYAAMLAAAK